jgi:hypothetical protein
MLKILAFIVSAVMASFNTNVAVPKEAGLGLPVEVVGTVGGFSCEFVRVAVRMTEACPLTAYRIIGRASRAVRRVMA